MSNIEASYREGYKADRVINLAPGQILEMKSADNVWDAIAADLAAVTAATNGPDEKSSEDLGVDVQKTKNSDSSHDSVRLQVESDVKETQDATSRGACGGIDAKNRSNTLRDSSGLPVTDEAQGGLKVVNIPNPEPLGCKEEEAEPKNSPKSAQNIVEILGDSSDEDGTHDDPTGEEEKEDKGEYILGKRNRNSDHRVTGGFGKKLKVHLPVSNDVVELCHREQPDGTTLSGENSTTAQEQRHKSDWVEPFGANMHLPPGLDKFHRVFTSLNTACGYLLKQQLVPSWQNVKQAVHQLSGEVSETIGIEDVRRLAQLCPRIVMLSQFSGEGEDATFHIQLFDPADALKVEPPGSTNGVGAVNAQANSTSDPTSAGRQVSDSEAKIIVERRQKAFQMLLAQMAHQFQVSANAGERLFGGTITNIRALVIKNITAPQSASVPVNCDEAVKHRAMLPHPAMLRHPSHEGQHTMGALLQLPTQSIVIPPPPLLTSQQLQQGYMNIAGGYPGTPFPLPSTNAFLGSFSQQLKNNYAGYQLSSLPPLPSLLSSLPSTFQPSTVPPNSSVPHRSQPTVTPPLGVEVPEAPAASEPSPYHGMSLNKARRRRSRNWDTWEVLLLVQAKKTEWERSESSSGKDRFETSVERWKRVEKFLKENKVVDRDAAACKNKWESTLSDYKSIKDWNRKPENTVYSLLSPAEKKAGNLPVVFASSVVELMDTFQGKSSHIPPAVVDSLARNNTAVSGGAASGGDASGAEDSGEAHPSAHVGDGTHGSAGRRKKSIVGTSPLVAAFDRLSANMFNIEKGRDERSERIWALENRKYDLEKCKFELQARKVESEKEDRKGLIRVLGNLAGAFHRMADKM